MATNPYDGATPLPRGFYARDPREVARDLLGAILIRPTDEGICAGRIVETEAYLAVNDTACHTSRGPNRKNASMYGPPGHLYVYPIHAQHCLNAVTESAGIGSAVLIRALEPILGMELMGRRRGTTKLRDLARGPARLCEALAVDRTLDGWDLVRGEQIWVAAGPEPLTESQIARTVRIGVTSAHDLELRFVVRDNPFVSS